MIRKATDTDFDFIYNLYMHPSINPFLLYEIMDAESFRPIYTDLMQKGVLFIYSDGEADAGMFKLVPMTYRNSHIAYLGGVAVHPAFAGKGYGNKMMKEIVAFAKERGFGRIELSVASSNDKAIHLYTKAGFEKEGVLRNYTYLASEKRYLDEVLMSWLATGK
jgi:RimJ/RimL family protein N-acetyltransferase